MVFPWAGFGGFRTRLVDISYDLAKESDILVKARRHQNATYETVRAVTGDVGKAVSAGTGKLIVWDAEADFPNSFFPQAQVMLVVETAPLPVPYTVSGKMVSHGEPLGLSGGRIVATQYGDNAHIETRTDIFGNWSLSGIVGPARLIGELPGGPSAQFRLNPVSYEVNGPESGVVFQREFGDGRGVDLYPDLSNELPPGESLIFADLDPVLRGRDLLDIGPDDPITPEMAATIKSIHSVHIGDHVIADLSGAEQLVELRSMDLADQPVTDFSPLKDLPYLQTLWLNPDLDLSNIAELTQLRNLGLNSFKGSNLDVLSVMVNLEQIDLEGSLVTDFSGIGSLPNLDVLMLAGGQVRDVSQLGNLPALRYLDLTGTNVVDIVPLSNVSNLVTLYLADTAVNDISPLLGLENLRSVTLQNTSSIAWEDVNEPSWGIVRELKLRGVNVQHDPPPASFPFVSTGGFDGPAGVEVSLIIESIDPASKTIELVESGGSWEIPMTGSARITPSAVGYNFDPVSVTVSWDTGPVLFSMTRFWNEAGGRILDEDGKPVEGIEVRFTRINVEPEEVRTAMTDAAGNYKLEFPSAAKLRLMPISTGYAFEAADGGLLPVEIQIGTGSETELDFTAYPRPAGLIAYQSGGLIGLLDSRTGATVGEPLVASGASGSHLQWSPDGSEVAYNEFEQRIRAIKIDGGGSRTLVELADFPLGDPAFSILRKPFSWSSSGEIVLSARLIASLHGQGPYLLWRVTPPNRLPQQVELERFILAMDPDWSPGGERIVFNGNPNWETAPSPAIGMKLHVANADGSGLLNLELDGFSPAWSPAGDRIAYSDGEDILIFTIDEEGVIGEPVVLEEGENPAWSPDGRWIVFSRDGSLRVRSFWPDASPSVRLGDGVRAAWQP